MARIQLLAAIVLLLSAGLLSALTVPACPDANRHVCIFSGVTLEPIKPGTSGVGFSTSQFQCPVNAPITSGIGQPYKNLNGEQRRSEGVEMTVAEGTPVKAAAGGKVTISKTDLLGPGIFVVIRHASNPNVETTYGYLQHAKVTEGDDVKAGQEIGTSGKTGSAKVPSVYFELRRGGLPQRDVETICKTAPVAVAPVLPKPVAGIYDVKSRSEFRTSQVQLAGIGPCVKQTEAICPQTGTAQHRGRSWRTADPTCIFKKASEIYRVPYSLLRSVLGQESGGRQFAESAYAQGYTQMTPETAAGMGIGQDKVFDPYYNICGGVEYLSRQLKNIGNVECALAAYNAGPYDREVQSKDAGVCRNHRYSETRNYVVSITAAWEKEMRAA